MKLTKTVFDIPKMDCPSEENLIRVKLSDIKGIKKLEFNLEKRELSVYHSDNLKYIEESIHSLNLGGKIVNSEEIDFIEREEEKSQRQILILVLLINFAFFLIEIITGLISNSMGLVADSLDMLADAFVYGISLYAVGSTVQRKKKIATLAGIFQLTLAIIGFVEVLRRFLGFEKVPDFMLMIIVSFFAAIANGICLYLLQKSKSKEAHIRASMIFTSNDVIINIGVITAGILVLAFNSQLPDLIIGATVFVLVISGAIRILKLGK
jgi:Co/Zn/Cd efflux system component